MPKFDIPIIATVNAKNIDEARQRAYKAAELLSEGDEDPGLRLASLENITLSMANDSTTNVVNQRIVILHPEDVDKDYDVDQYNEELKENLKEKQ